MSTPFTTEEATLEFECKECKEFPKALNRLRQFFKCNTTKAGGAECTSRAKDLEYIANPYCNGDCVLGATTSVHCIVCDERIWFKWRANIPDYFQCPYCTKKTYNSMAKSHNAMRNDVKTK